MPDEPMSNERDGIRPVLRITSTRTHRAFFVGLVSSVLSACAIPRSAGSNFAAGAVAQIDREDSTIVAIQRRLADSMGVFLGREFDNAVLGPAQRTWGTMRDAARDETDSVSIRLANRLEGDLNRSIQQLLRDNFRVLDEEGSHLTVSIVNTLGETVGRGLTDQVALAGDTLTRRFASTLALSLDEILRPALHSLMLDLRDSLQVRCWPQTSIFTLPTT